MLKPRTVLLLPGMDGTGHLFDPFVEAAPDLFRCLVATLPRSADYGQLLAGLADVIPVDGEFIVVAESFSGPLGVSIAAAYSKRVSALILCNSFVAAPRSRALRFLPWALLFALPLSGFAIRSFLTGFDASPELVHAVRRAIRRSPPRLLAARLRSVLSLKSGAALAEISCPVLCLRGSGDRLIPASVASRVVRQVRVGREMVIAGPHLLLQAVPQEAWAAIVSFLSHSLDQAPPAPGE